MTTDLQLKRDASSEPAWEMPYGGATIGPESRGDEASVDVETGAGRRAARSGSARQESSGENAPEIYSADLKLSPGGRTDEEITHSAELALQWVSHLPKGAIRIYVESGEITLSGEVEWDSQRRNAASAVRYLAGVNAIIDNVVLNSRASAQGIRADIVSALDRHTGSLGQLIAVDVRDGDVTLSGTVPNWWAREIARESAWSVAGVRRVLDNLVVDVWPRVGRRS
jgi:osmotically-inducible protein OsmY